MEVYEERIDGGSSAALVEEHVARYRFAEPAIAGADLWVDLGCGNGYAAARALECERVPQALFVDVDAGAVEKATARFAGKRVETLKANLASAEELDQVKQRAEAQAGDGRICVTCFEVVEHLDNFVPLLELLRELAGAGHTAVLSVPNDAFWAQHNPYHHAIWGGEAFEEFRGLLPEGSVIAHQLPLAGSSIRALDDQAELERGVIADDPTAAPSHYLAALGPAARELRPVAAVVQANIMEQRSWERQRDSDLAWMRQREADLAYYETEAKRLQRELDELRSRTKAT